MWGVHPVLHFNTSCEGGAAIAARKIHDSLTANGVDSRFHHLNGTASKPGYFQFEMKRRLGLFGRVWHGLVRRARDRIGSDPSGSREPFGWSTIPGQRLPRIRIPLACIIHLHWVNGLIDYRTFFRGISPSTPIVWTLHDMNPLTGGCHYSWGCDGFTDICADCPQLRGFMAADVAARNQDLRRRSLANRRLHIVANSTWLEREARRSAILSSAASFRTIHYGIDLECFQPHDSNAAKNLLGIDPSRTVIGFGSYRLDAHRKGFKELCTALEMLDPGFDPVLLTFGHDGGARAPNGVEWVNLGAVGSSRILPLLYNAADIFVMPSLEEAVGQTALEALACATPVVAFGVGGVTDFVLPGETGLLATAGDIEGFSRQIAVLLGDGDLRNRLGASGRRLMEREYSLDRQLQDYVDLYREVAESS